MIQLENAKVAGRIGDTRSEIAARLIKLHDIFGLHFVEQQAIDDALSGLRCLECTERLDANTETPRSGAGFTKSSRNSARI
jgi:hypothetical protein